MGPSSRHILETLGRDRRAFLTTFRPLVVLDGMLLVDFSMESSALLVSVYSTADSGVAGVAIDVSCSVALSSAAEGVVGDSDPFPLFLALSKCDELENHLRDV